jgi:hypothetical protein
MEGDRAMDVMACILAYGLELKDKPSRYINPSFLFSLMLFNRIKRGLSLPQLYAPIPIC